MHISLDALHALERLPNVSQENRARGGRTCKICGASAWQFDALDFLKVCDEQNCYSFGFSQISVPYYRCTSCDFLFSDFCDDWSVESFARHIYNDDYIKVDPDYLIKRPTDLAIRMAAMLAEFKDCRILDYGSGSGSFAEQMRNRGFQRAESYDPFSHPTRPQGKFDIVTSFEVLEHTPTPTVTMSDLADFLTESGCAIATTELQPDNISQIRGSWFYAAPRNGHISLYSRGALAILAKRNALLYTEGGGLHGFLSPRQSRLRDVITDAIGPVLERTHLWAPPVGREISPETWDETEARRGGFFRWTRTREISWELPSPGAYPCRLDIFIPIFAEIKPDFAESSVIQVGAIETPVTRTPSGIAAEIELVCPPRARIVLRTPELASPADLRGESDYRKLGLAIPTES